MIRFIAEIGSNFNGSLSRTLTLIQEAKRIGCWAVKFQLFDENLYAPEFKSQREKLKAWALPESFIPEIEECCADLDIQFGCSVFSLESVEAVKYYVDYLKIGSYELLYVDLIRAVVETGKPWILSAGMINDINIENLGLGSPVLDQILINKPIAILHCNSNYPAKPESCNLKYINELKEYFNISGGWSDHTVEPGVLYKAIALGAEYIEFHFDLEDGQGHETQIGHCWRPSQIAEIIRNVGIGEIATESADTGESEAAKWRTDPADGRRPLRKFRKELLKNE